MKISGPVALVAIFCGSLTVRPAESGQDIRVNQDASGLAQSWTTIAANPLDPDNLVVAYSDDFVTDPGVTWPVGYAWSRDGGSTWHSAQLGAPGFQGGFDPIIAADPSGRFHIAVGGIQSDPSQPALLGLLFFTSTDGGSTFDAPVVVDPLPADAPCMASDPVSGAMYVAYTGNFRHYGRPVVLFRTGDGARFSEPTILGDGGTKGILCRMAIGPAGEIYVAWSNLTRELIFFQRSLDGGRTWLKRAVPLTHGYNTPPFQIGLYAALLPVTLAVDRGGAHSGRLYVGWSDKIGSDYDVFIVHSDDRGATFSAPARVNDDREGNLADQFFPNLGVDALGAVHLTFLDQRDDPSRTGYSVYLATSTDGGVRFGPNVRVSDGVHGAGEGGSLGPYTGMAVGGRFAHPVWPDARFGDLDIFTHAVNLDDFDGDGIMNDGDGDGQYADHPCTGGQTRRCDDNCPGVTNPDQADADGDGVGDACEAQSTR